MNPMVDLCICLEAIFRYNAETQAVLGSSCSAKEIKSRFRKLKQLAFVDWNAKQKKSLYRKDYVNLWTSYWVINQVCVERPDLWTK